jgi:hypothetical protein
MKKFSAAGQTIKKGSRKMEKLANVDLISKKY